MAERHYFQATASPSGSSGIRVHMRSSNFRIRRSGPRPRQRRHMGRWKPQRNLSSTVPDVPQHNPPHGWCRTSCALPVGAPAWYFTHQGDVPLGDVQDVKAIKLLY